MKTSSKRYDDATAAGLTSIHRNSSGAPMGGYAPDGTPVGTKRRAWQPPLGQRTGNVQTPGLDRYKAMQPGANYRPVNPYTDKTQAASGNVLNARQNLYSEMEKAGPGGINPEMRKKARSWGVTDSGFNMAAQRIKDNAQKALPLPSPSVPLPPNVAPSYPNPPVSGTRPNAPAPLSTTAPAPSASTPPIASPNRLSREYMKPPTPGAGTFAQAAGITNQKPTSPALVGPPSPLAPVGPPSPPAAVGPPAPPAAVGPPVTARSWQSAPIPPKPSLTARFEGNSTPKPAENNRIAEASKRLKEKRKNAPKFTDKKPAWRGTGFGGIMDFLSKPAI